MSMEDKTGGPAFPTAQTEGEAWIWRGSEGMTLRDYFAAKAMQGVIQDVGGKDWAKATAKIAYEMADAMIEERGK